MINKIETINLSGGIIGLLLTNPKRALANNILRQNSDGWNVVQIITHTDTNLFLIIIKILVLILTLFLWTWGAGYIVIYERAR